MGLLDGMLGGALGAGLAVAATKFIDEHGGVSGIANQLQTHGLGDTVNSWIGKGENHPIAAEDLQRVFGSGTLADMAARIGMTPEELTQKMSQILPAAVDQMTPDGVIPPAPAKPA